MTKAFVKRTILFLQCSKTLNIMNANLSGFTVIPASRDLHWIRKPLSLRGYCQTGANLPTERKRALQTRVPSIAAAMLKPRLDYVIR